MCLRVWILSHRQKYLVHVKHVQRFYQGNFTESISKIKSLKPANCESEIGVKANMIKITPLSELVKNNDTMKTNNSGNKETVKTEDLAADEHIGETTRTVISGDVLCRVTQTVKSQVEQGTFCNLDSEESESSADQNANASRIMKEQNRPTKRTLIPKDLLYSVSQTVKTQMEQGTFGNPDSRISESLMDQNDNASITRKEDSNLEIESFDTCHDENEDKFPGELCHSDSSDVYDISVLFSGTIICYLCLQCVFG